MPSEEIIEKRYRNFMILLYPEWDNFNDVLFDIKGSFKKYAYIKHEKEEKEKKDHYHLILSLDNPRSLESLSNRLSIPKHLIQPIKSLRASCRYLIHLDTDDKKEYELNQVIVSNAFKHNFFKSFDDLESPQDILQNIFNYINGLVKSSKDLTPIEIEVILVDFVVCNNYDTIFKKYYNTITKFILYKCKSL